MIGAIVLTHGEVGKALIQAAESIYGQVDNICSLSTSRLSMNDINRMLRNNIVDQNWNDGTMIMVSLLGGSCWNSAASVAQQLPDIEVVSGVNLAMIISFLTKRDQYSLPELSEIIKQDGIRGISRLIRT